MTDLDIFALGCAVTFVALGGAYVYMREHFARRLSKQEQEREEHAAPVAVEPLTDRAG